MTKIQLTLTTQEADLLSRKAMQLGYNLTRFIKFLISREALNTFKESNVPTFRMSARAERNALQALKEYREGKAIPIESFEDLNRL